MVRKSKPACHLRGLKPACLLALAARLKPCPFQTTLRDGSTLRVQRHEFEAESCCGNALWGRCRSGRARDPSTPQIDSRDESIFSAQDDRAVNKI